MAYRFPNWLKYVVLGFIVAVLGFSAYAFEVTPTVCSTIGSEVVLSGIDVLLLALLTYAYIYFSRYLIQFDDAVLLIRGAFRIRSVPFVSIAQVITVSAPRGGTDSFLLDKDDGVLAKIDGGLVGFDSIIVELEQKLRLYLIPFYKRGVLGPWEMQLAGDSHWVRSDAPALFRKNNRRVNFIMIAGCALIAIFIALSAWLKHGGFDRLP